MRPILTGKIILEKMSQFVAKQKRKISEVFFFAFLFSLYQVSVEDLVIASCN